MGFMLMLTTFIGCWYPLKRWPETLVAIGLCFLSLICYLNHRNKKQLILINWPFLGTLPLVLRNIHRLNEWWTEVFNSLGSSSFYIRVPPFSTPKYLLTCHPSNLDHILRTNFSNYPKGRDFTEIFDILGDGIFSTDETWHAQRKIANLRFTSRKFRDIVAKLSRKVVSDELLPLLAHVATQESAIDLQDVFLRFTVDSIGRIIFGRDVSSLSTDLPIDELATAFEDAQKAIQYRQVMPTWVWKLLRWLRVGRERKLAEAAKTADTLIGKYILLKREELVKGVEGNDLLSMYMSVQGEMNDDFFKSDKFLRDNMLNFVIAGRDTTASGLTWFFWLISKTPRAEAKILEELELVFSKKESTKGELDTGAKQMWVFDSDDLRGLVYLHAALCETERLYPAVPVIQKGIIREDALPDGTIARPGMLILLSVYAMGRIAWIWGENCLEFKPERWIDDEGKLKHEATSKLAAFGFGPRTCLGKDMAFTQMKMAAAAILFNFHVEVVEGHPVSIKRSTVLQMNDGLKVKMKKRAH